MPEFNEAVDRVIAGPERKSRVISQKRTRDHRLPRGRPRSRRLHAAERRPAVQDQHHLARHGRRFHPLPSRRGPPLPHAEPAPRPSLRRCLAAWSPKSWSSAKSSTGPSDDLEHATRDRAADGHAVGHERAPWSSDLRPQGRDGVPRPRDLRARATTARRSPRRSTKRSARSSTRRTTRPKKYSPTTATSLDASSGRCSRRRDDRGRRADRDPCRQAP